MPKPIARTLPIADKPPNGKRIQAKWALRNSGSFTEIFLSTGPGKPKKIILSPIRPWRTNGSVPPPISSPNPNQTSKPLPAPKHTPEFAPTIQHTTQEPPSPIRITSPPSTLKKSTPPKPCGATKRKRGRPPPRRRPRPPPIQPKHIYHETLKPIPTPCANQYTTVVSAINMLLKDSDHAWFAPHPRKQFNVDEQYEMYLKCTKNPKGLKCIYDKLLVGPAYRNAADVATDVRLVFGNAMGYHKSDSFWWRSANKLLQQFERMIKSRRPTSQRMVKNKVSKKRRKAVHPPSIHAQYFLHPVDGSQPPYGSLFDIDRISLPGEAEKCKSLTVLINRMLPNITMSYVEALMKNDGYDKFGAITRCDPAKLPKNQANIVTKAPSGDKLRLAGGVLCRRFRDKGFVELCFLVVATDYQRLGCGRKLMRAFKLFAHNNGIPTILAYADLKAVPFFKRCGFHRNTRLPRDAWYSNIYHYSGSTLMSCDSASPT